MYILVTHNKITNIKNKLGINPEDIQISIRDIQAEDNPQVRQLIRQVMSAYNCVGDGYSIQDPEVEDMYTNYQGKRSRYYVLAYQDKIYGGAGVAPLKGGAENTCELKKMYYYPEIRGKGYGKQVLTLILEDARKFGYTQCYLETVDRMEAAAQLYQKFGFTRLEKCLGNTGHSGCDSYYILDL